MLALLFQVLIVSKFASLHSTHAVVFWASLLWSGLRRRGTSLFWGQLNYHMWVHFFKRFWWNKKLGYKKRKVKYPDCLAYHTACLVCNLTFTLGRKQVLSFTHDVVLWSWFACQRGDIGVGFGTDAASLSPCPCYVQKNV